MRDKAVAMVMASFAADSLALGAHWIYDTAEIDKRFGRVDSLLKPASDSFHATKDVGEFTHYGDQAMILLESVAHCKGFDRIHFASSWRAFLETYDGYRDHATKDTLKNLDAGTAPDKAGSDSSDLGGAARIAPLVFALRGDRQKLLSGAKTQTIMTHNHPLVAKSAEFLADCLWRILQGSTPLNAVREASGEQAELQKLVLKGLESAGRPSRETIKEFGQMCETTAALPCVIHLVSRYENDLKTALVENVMAGGDSAARGMVVGMILGAYLGPQAIPAEWLNDLKAGSRITQLLDSID